MTDLPQRIRERHEMAVTLGLELIEDIAGTEPELDDERLGYVSIQLSRSLWLRVKHLPTLADLLAPFGVELDD